MHTILLAVTDDVMAMRVKRTWDLHEQYYRHNPDVHYGPFTCNILVDPVWENVVRYCINETAGYDAIISRGSLATSLKQHFIDIPTVEIPITAQDFSQAISLAVASHGRKKIGIVGTPNMLAMLPFYQRHSDLDVTGVPVNPFEENYREKFGNAVDQAVRQGCGIIIGGVITEAKCRERAIPCQRLETSEESIWQALTEARRTAHVFRQERHAAMTYRTIVDYAHEGIIATDITGNISLFNNMSSQILGVTEKSALGKPVETIFAKRHHQLTDDKQYINAIITHNNTRMTMNKVRLVMGEEHVGSVFTFQDVTSITEIERLVRSKLHKRGHVAKYTFDHILGASKAITAAVNDARVYAGADSNIIIYGESGTGKEIIAQAVHNASSRSKSPFVAVNCAAIPENLLESELFGYVEGAFTGAAKGGKQGLFEQAHQGAIFLDEICDIPMNLQGRLLRVIQEQEVMRIGDDRIIPINVRVLCASNKWLQDLVDQGVFREDLYYRLNVLHINLPPLRERGDDILLLARHYCERHAKAMGKPVPALSVAMQEKMLLHNWKGNVRELKNLCERLVVAGAQTPLHLHDLLRLMGTERNKPLPLADDASQRPQTSWIPQASQEGYAITLSREEERARIDKALAAAKYSKLKAAKMLGISRTTLWKKMKEYGEM